MLSDTVVNLIQLVDQLMNNHYVPPAPVGTPIERPGPQPEPVVVEIPMMKS